MLFLTDTAMRTTFTPKHYRVMLERRCMIVARTRPEGTWKAYCFIVAGQNHDREQDEAIAEGQGVPVLEHVARSMFGHLEDMPYSR